jgi:hypothetical protein
MAGRTSIEGLRSLKVHLSTVKTLKMRIVTSAGRIQHIEIDSRWKFLTL